MVLAESLFDRDVDVEDSSRLSIGLTDVQNDGFVQAYFDAFSESQDLRTRNLIKLWLSMTRFRSVSGLGSHHMRTEGQRVLKVWTEDPDLRKVLPQCLYDRLNDQMKSPDLDAGMFDPVLHSIWDLVELAFIKFQSSSQFFLKYQIDLMTKGHICLSDLLFYDETLVYFRQFMEQEGMQRFVDFLLVVHSIRHSPLIDPHVVWSTFFISDTNSRTHEPSHYLFLSEKVTHGVRQAILNQEPDCFHVPAALVHQYLQKTYFSQFLDSPAYFNLTTKLIRRFQQMQLDSPTAGIVVCESEDGLSVQESMSSGQGTGTLCPSTTSCTIRGTSERKTGFLGDVSAGRRGNGLQILHVDRYGRLISDLEPEPDKKQERSYISQSIRKLVGRRSVSNQDANQALAWKLAQIIIDDVVNVTAEYT